MRCGPLTPDYYAIKMWRLVRRPLNYKGLIEPIDPAKCTPDVVIHYVYPKGRYSSRMRNLSYAGITRARTRLIGTNKFAGEFSAAYKEELVGTLAREHMQRVSSHHRFLRLDMIDSTRGASHGYRDCVHALVTRLTRSTEFRYVDSARFDTRVKIRIHHSLYLDIYVKV